MKHEFDHPFFLQLSKYNHKVLLKKFGELNFKVYKQKFDKKDKFLHIKLSDYGLGSTGYMHISHWTVRDIILQIIRRHSTYTFSGLSTISDREMYYLIGLYNDYENELSKMTLKINDVHFTLFAIGEQQFRGQVSAFIVDKKRNDIILNNLDTSQYFDVDNAIKDTLELNRDELRFILMLIISFYITKNFEDPYKLSIDTNVFDEKKIPNFYQKFYKVIDYYTVSKDYILSYNLNYSRYRHLFAKIDDVCVLIDGFMLEDKIADAELWITRDYYQSNVDLYGKEYFPNKYGELFEEYIEYVCLQEGLKHKIFNINIVENSNSFFFTYEGKKVDYVLETKKYRMVIECKSGIKPAAIKDSNTHYEVFFKFFKKIFERGAEQILTAIENSKATEKTIIGVIIHAEKTFMKTRIKNKYLLDSGLDKYRNILLLDIHEFELLIGLLKQSEDDADELLGKFILNNNMDQLDFIQIIEKEAKIVSFLEKVELYQEESLEQFLTEESLSYKKTSKTFP